MVYGKLARNPDLDLAILFRKRVDRKLLVGYYQPLTRVS